MAHTFQELAVMAEKYGHEILNETMNSGEAMIVMNIMKDALHSAKTMGVIIKEFSQKTSEDSKGQTKIGDFCGKKRRDSNCNRI